MLSIVVATTAAAILIQLPAASPPAAAPDEDDLVPLTLAPPAAQPASTEPTEGWYGLPALLADGASLALGAAAFGSKDEGLLFLGTAGFLLGAPLNHLIHRQYGAAGGSFMLRVLASGVAVAVFIVDWVHQGCDPDQGPPCSNARSAFLGGLVLAAAAVVDDVRLARVAPPPAPRARVSWAPGVVITPNLGLLSLGGSF